MIRNAKIIATIGPASSDPNMLRRLAEAGMDVARLNFSHGDHAEHLRVIGALRRISADLGRAITVLQDLQGPKIRIGPLKSASPIAVEAGKRLTLRTSKTEGDETQVQVDYPELVKDVEPGDRILLGDGRPELRVVRVGQAEVETEIILGGSLTSHQGICLPRANASASCLSEKDLSDLAFGLEHGVDAVAMSFVRKAQDVIDLKQSIRRLNPPDSRPPQVIAKLERAEALQELSQIIDEADGVMVARGDLGLVLSAERVPSVQKRILRQANLQLKLSITATQMLESMMHSPRPTRAEASDVANAVFDGSDVVMLSGETAVGDYPVEAVETMGRIIQDAEAHIKEWGRPLIEQEGQPTDDAVATSHAARALANDRGVKAIAVFTRSGKTARLMSKTRPDVPIIGYTPDERTYSELSLCWGVSPKLIPMVTSVEAMIVIVEQDLLRSEVTRTGDQVVVVASLPVGAAGPANFTYLHTVR
jgi:pyruvate kinase